MYQEYSDITKVVETSSTSEVNKFLSNGWKLLNTYTTTNFSTEASSETLMYVLGKFEV
jgi:hypothetical protein